MTHRRRMKQSRCMSLVEACTNVVVGLAVATLTNILVLPMLGFPISLHDAGVISAIFTAVSIARSYLLRRVFEFFTPRGGVHHASYVEGP